MLKWFSGEEGEPGSGGPGSPQKAAGGGEIAVEEMAERLAQTEQLVSQLKEMIREKDATLRSKDDQLKVEKEACDAKLSKLRLQNKAKVTSLTTQLEELKKQHPGTPTHSKKGSEGDQASRGKIVLLKRKVEELEHQLAQRDEELETKRRELESRRQRGEEMDAMLTERDKRLAEKEAYIVHLQMGLAGDQAIAPAPQQQAVQDGGVKEELQLLVESLTKKVGEAEERYSLLEEQTDGLKELLASEKEQYSQKESMFKQNIQTFKDIIIQKDNQLMEINTMHEQELFRLAAKSDASADLEQLLKALKQKLHEKEEVLLGKTQVIDVLQGEVDGRDQQIKELTERLRRLQVERESLESKMEAEKHVMRAQLRDLMEKQQVEVRRMAEQHQAQTDQIQQELLGQLEELRRASLAAPPASQEASGSGGLPTDSASVQRIAELEAQAKQKTEEASRSEAKFLKMKAWSKSRIRQLEDELKKSQAGVAPPDLTALRSQITALEEEREENQWKVEQYEELKAKNEMLETKLVLYEEQQRTLQADLEQFTKRAASQASESGSADDAQSQVLEWQEMVAEAVSARDRAREEKAAMVLRVSHMEEEREALATRQQELEDELAQVRGLGQHRAKKLASPAQRSLQEDFEFDGQAPFQDPRSVSESTTPMEGENMGGWWPEYSSPDTDGLRSVVEELELERNQLQEQILSLEERCQDLEDRLQLQARIEALQNESERLQSQLVSVRSQQSRDAEKHQLQVNSLNEKLKGLSETQECLESSLIEKENTLAKTSEKLELIGSLRESLSEKEIQYKELSDKLLQTEHALESMTKKCSSSEKQYSDLKTEAGDLTQKLSMLKEKAQKQEITIETLQTELDQTNEDLDKLNTAHLEERAQLIHELQSCEREIDSLKDALSEKDKEISSLAANMAEYAEQVTALKQDIKTKEESLVQVENALSKAEREAAVIRDSQSSDQQTLNEKIAELVGKLRDAELELLSVKEERESKLTEVDRLLKQAEEDDRNIRDLRGEMQKQTASHRNRLSECETHIASLKEQLQESEELVSNLKHGNTSYEKLQQLHENELKSCKEEQNALLASLEEKLKAAEEDFNTKLQTRDLENEKLSKDLQESEELVSNLKHGNTSYEKLQQLHENELKSFKEEQNALLASLEAKLKAAEEDFNTKLQTRDSENEKLQIELRDKIQQHENELKSCKEEQNALLASLEAKLKAAEEDFNTKLQTRDSENEKLQIELRDKIQQHENELKSCKEEQKALLSSLEEKLKAAEEDFNAKLQTRDLENEKLSKELEESEELVSQLKHKNSNYEKLQQELRDKDQLHENELKSFKEEQNKLLAQLEKSNDQVQSLSRQLEEQMESEKSVREMMEEKLETLASLEDKLKAAEVEFNVELQTRDSENKKLQQELHDKEQLHENELKSCKEEQNKLLVSLEEKLKAAEEDFNAKLQTRDLENEKLSKDLLESEELVSQLKHINSNYEKLQQELRDKDHLHENELKSCKEEQNKLLASLEAKQKAAEEDFNAALQSRDSENEKLSKDLKNKAENFSKLKTLLKSTKKEKQQLEEKLEGLNKELELLRRRAGDLEEKLSSAVELNDGLQKQLQQLAEQKQKLEEEATRQGNAVSEATAQISALETQLSENKKIIQELQTEKMELSELNRVLEQGTHSNSEVLSEKTNECSRLGRLLGETEAEVSRLRDEAQSFERTGAELRAEIETEQKRQTQLQETLSQLQAELAQRDAVLDRKHEENQKLQNEITTQENVSSELRAEAESLQRQSQTYKDELNDRNEAVKNLSQQIRVMEENGKTLESEAEGMRAELAQLRAACESREKQLAQQLHAVSLLNSQLEAAEEQNSSFNSQLRSLTEDNQRLQEELENYAKSLSELTTERSSLRETTSKFETQISDDRMMMDGLLKEKEELKRILKESEESSSAGLLQKTNECTNLSKTLREKEEQLQSLGEQVGELGSSLREKEETMSMLQEQRSALKSGLKQKSGEVELLTDRLSQLQEELESLKQECLEAKHEMEEKEEVLKRVRDEFQTQKDELNKRNESVISLSGQLGAMNESAVEMEAEMAELKESLKKLSAENQRLLQEDGQRKAEIIDFRDNVQALAEQNARFKSELSAAHELIADLRAEAREKEALIQQLHAAVSTQTEQLKRSGDDNLALQRRVSELEGEVSGLTSESGMLKNTLEKSEQSNVEHHARSSATLESLGSHLKAKDAECESLKEQISHLKESVAKLSDSLRVRSDEAESFRKVLEDKDAALRERSDEAESLRKVLKDKEAALQERSKSLEDVRRRADEASLFKTQFRESAESVSQMQNQIRLLQKSEDETQSAFDNLQEKYAANLEELQDVRKQLAERKEEASDLQKEAQTLQKEKDEALASHQASVSLLTVEIERLKSQHLQVATQMNALTENLEQREMALHAINSQYTAQAKRSSQLLSDTKKLEEENQKLKEEIRSAQDVGNEKACLQGEVRKLVAEKEELQRRHGDVQTAEKQSLQAEVSAKDEEISQLKANVEKIEQILQDSEREWLLVLDRETQHKTQLSEQLQRVESEMKAKDVKVDALKRDLESLQEKLADAAAAVARRSDQLCAKESEASTSRVQLQKVLAAIQEKETENRSLQEVLEEAEDELRHLGNGSESVRLTSSASATKTNSLRDSIRRLRDRHQAEVRALKDELDREKRNDEKIAHLQETVETLQTLLQAEEEKTIEASVKHGELKAKEEQIGCLVLQIGQQKELLAGLSQQLKDRDASIAQVMQSASNERMKLDEENECLSARLEKMERAHQTATELLEEQMSRSGREMERKDSENLQLTREKADLQSQITKVSKDKDATRKKLQAALLVRKDLMKRVEEYEKQRNERNDAEQRYEGKISLLEKEILEKDGEILEAKAQSERLEEHLEVLKSLLKETETCLREKNSIIEQLQQRLEDLHGEIQTCKDELNNKNSSVSSSGSLETELVEIKVEKAALHKKLQAALLARKDLMKRVEEYEKQKDESAAAEQRYEEKISRLEKEKKENERLVEQLEVLKSSLKETEACLREKNSVIEQLQQRLEDRNDESSASSTDCLETELTQIKAEKAALQKKAQAALLARKETAKKAQEKEKKLSQELAELKDDYKALLEQRCRQTNELNAVQMEARQLEELHKTSLEELNTLRRIVEERDKTLQDLTPTLAEIESQRRSETALKDELKESERREEALKSELHSALKETETCREVIRSAERQAEQENRALREENAALEAKRSICRSELEEEKHANEEKNCIITEQEEQISRLKLELETTTVGSSQQLEELNTLRRIVEERDKTLHDLAVEESRRRSETAIKDELKESERREEALKSAVDLFQQPSETETRREVDSLNQELRDEKHQKDYALLGFQAQLFEKDELIAALELQLQQQVKTHEVVLGKMKSEADGLQKSQQDGNKAALLTRKLQAALVSRKELLKENSSLKDEVENLRREKHAECSDLESSLLTLKERNAELEGSSASVLGENRSLAAACGSLKLTIESITQQKQAFSCQLESLKDSQAEELSRWKSKHAELKQEYESLLQAYENVGSEMDKMRQLLEAAKRERQDAVGKLHQRQAEAADLERRAREAEEENDRLKERMHKFVKEKRQKMEELEEENRRLKELTELHGDGDLSEKNQQLEEETRRLTEKIAEIQAENGKLESNANNVQVKLDEALSLNAGLTAQIEAQKTELVAQIEICDLLQKEKQNLSTRMESIRNDHELQLGRKEEAMKDALDKHDQETLSLTEKLRILEDDKSLLQEELENVQEISDKLKKENEYLETVVLKSSERLDELTESVAALTTQNERLSAQLAASTAAADVVRREKEQEQLKLVREFEEKLKNVQRGNEGSKNVRRELQELLREKHQEINQLQQNCIRYQEVFLDLESDVKRSRSACDKLEIDLKTSSEKMSALQERNEEAEAELVGQKKLLQEAEEKMALVESERRQSDVSQQVERSDAAERLKSPDETLINSHIDRQFVLQQQMDELKNLKEEESQKVDELLLQLDRRDLQINTLKRAAATQEAKLVALSANPEAAAASKLWSDLYQKSLHEKDKQLLEQGFTISRFLEDMRGKDKELNELRVAKSRLERTLNEYAVAAAAQQRQLFVLSATNAEMSDTMALAAAEEKELAAQLERKERENNALSRRLADEEDSVSRLRLQLQQTEKTNADADNQLQLLRARLDRVQADFQKQEGVSLQLKTLLQGKDAEISSLLSCRDGQVSGYLETLQANHRRQVSLYEDRLTSSRYQRDEADKELRTLEAKVKSLQIQVHRSVQDKEQMAAKMESFKNSMVSLQSERERLVSENRLMEAKLSLKGSDGSPGGETGANKGLKHEIRKLLHQMDDLNSENAMLRAQLVRYREDLNQVLSLKDNQLKVLLKKQQDVIRTLENQKAAAEKTQRESQLELQKEEEANDALKTENSKLAAKVSNLEAEASTRKEEMASTSEGRVIADLRDAVAAKAAECSDLQQKLLQKKLSADELKEKMQRLESETDEKLTEAEDRYNGELDKLEREAELMRTEREAADRKLAELDQELAEAKSQLKDSKMQKESLCKAMAALQDDRDQLIQDFKVLRSRYDEELRETRAALNKTERSFQDASSDSAMFAKERDVLAHKLAAVESEDVHAELSKLLDEVSKGLAEKERELKQAVGENGTFSRQLAAFSRSMASLQGDRDRLMEELAAARRAVQSGLLTTRDGPVRRLNGDELQHKEVDRYQGGAADTKSEAEKKELPPVQQEGVALAAQSGLEEAASRMEAERMQLRRDLQRCIYEIQQRDQYLQQINSKLQQAVEERGSVAAQLRAVSQTLRDTQNRCHWLESQGQTRGSAYTEVAPGAPQEKSNDSMIPAAGEAGQLRERLLEMELSLAEERARRETTEEALRLAEDRAKSVASSLNRDAQRDFSIEMEPEEEWEALSLNPNQPLLTRKVKGGVVACRRWLRGRSLYFSRLLTSRARSRYFFLAYLLTLHVLVLMCLSGAL